MKITWLGVFLALLATGAILFAYSMGKVVGKDRGFEEGYAWSQHLFEITRSEEEKDTEAEFKMIARTIYPIDQELWD
jgi:hypothetical protein